MSHANHETEIKLPAGSVPAARVVLRRCGFRIWRPRVFEANTVFDSEWLALGSKGCLLRVREAGGKVTLTYKGPAQGGPHKSREEIETQVNKAENFREILERLGFREVFRYEKYRAEYRAPGGSGVATLDETPIGVYLELEGDPEWIDGTAKRMGFTPEQYITTSYGRLYQEWCRERGIRPGNMVFQ